VNVATSGHQYVVERRYTDFEELHKQVLYLPCTCACACTFVYANLRAHKHCASTNTSPGFGLQLVCASPVQLVHFVVNMTNITKCASVDNIM